MSDYLSLLLGTALLRPYVFAFLAVHLLVATRDLGSRGAMAFTGWAWAVAFVAEYSATRTGIPFGLYHYTESTRGQELYLANVPFMDSLSFTFLAYAAFAVARLVLGRSRGLPVVILSGVLMMLLDVVIDPLAVRGDRWFLGRIFYYPEEGIYFGVPLSNFLGWALVGWVIAGGYCWCLVGRAPLRPASLLMGAALYYGVLVFNLAVTWWIGEFLLLATGLLVHAATALLLWACPRIQGVGAGTGARSYLFGESSAGFARASLGGGIGRGAKPPSEARL